MREAHLQQTIRKYLQSKGCLVLKQEPTSLIGIPDLLVIKDDMHFWVEVKTTNGRLSKGQVACHKELMRRNQYVFICKSVEDAEVALCLMLNL